MNSKSQQHTLERLRQLCPEQSTLYIVVRRSTEKSHYLDIYRVGEGNYNLLNGLVSEALKLPFDDAHIRYPRYNFNPDDIAQDLGYVLYGATDGIQILVLS